MVKVETCAYYVDNGRKRKIYRTRESPARYYYLDDNKRSFIDVHNIPVYMRSRVPFQNFTDSQRKVLEQSEQTAPTKTKKKSTKSTKSMKG